MKEYILFEDEYTKIIFQQDDDDENLSPEELISILSEYEMHKIKENRANKHKETIYIE